MDSAASVVQMVLSLVAVIAMILGLAWMTRRMQGLRANASSELRVKATLAVGVKERVVLIEAAGRQFLIGVAPGRVSLIDTLGAVPPPDATLDDAPGAPDAAMASRGNPGFREALSQQVNQLLRR